MKPETDVDGRKHEFDKVTADYSKAIEVAAYEDRGKAYNETGHIDQAIRDFSKAIELAPTSVVNYHRRAEAYMKQGDYEKSWEDVHRAEALGLTVSKDFLDKLRAASKRTQ